MVWFLSIREFCSTTTQLWTKSRFGKSPDRVFPQLHGVDRDSSFELKFASVWGSQVSRKRGFGRKGSVPDIDSLPPKKPGVNGKCSGAYESQGGSDRGKENGGIGILMMN
jgi:hypothetical protein